MTAPLLVIEVAGPVDADGVDAAIAAVAVSASSPSTASASFSLRFIETPLVFSALTYPGSRGSCGGRLGALQAAQVTCMCVLRFGRITIVLTGGDWPVGPNRVPISVTGQTECGQPLVAVVSQIP